MKSLKFLMFLGISVAIQLSVKAQISSYSVEGSVKNESGVALAQASVRIGAKQVYSNEHGTFYFTDIPVGKYTVIIEKEGYVAMHENIQVNEHSKVFAFVLSDKIRELESVQVTSVRSANAMEVEIGKIPIKPFDLPQATAIVNRATIDNQQSEQLSDVLKNVNGVYIMGNTGGYQEEISARGLAFRSDNTFKNGVRFNNSIMPEVSGLERMEILKGNAAILYGNVAAGGIMNLVTKKPKFERGAEIGMRMASYGFYKPTIDIYGSLNKSNTIAFRVNSAYQKSESFRDLVETERFYINPSLLFLLGKRVTVLLEGDYLSDTRTPDFGVGAINYTLIDVPRNTFLGTSWSNITSRQASATATLTVRLSRRWKLRSVSAFQSYGSDLFSTLRPNSSNNFIKEDGTWIRGVQRTDTDQNYFLSQLDFIGEFKTGPLSHTLIIGGDYDQYDTRTLRYANLSKYDTINVFAVDYSAQRSDIPDLAKSTLAKTPMRRSGLYVQDLIVISTKWKVLLGARFSYLESFSATYTYSSASNAESAQFDHAFSPKVGLVFQPVKTMSMFASYSNSFTPNSGVDINGAPLTPSVIDQYELGVKNDFMKGKMSLNVTAYHIVNSNVAQMVLENGNTNTSIMELTGEITSSGLEVDASYRPLGGLTFLAGYSFNECKYTKSQIYGAGAKLLYQPRNTANLSAHYEIEQHRIFKGLSFGLSALYFGDRFAGRLTRINVPNDDRKPIPLSEYFTVDASIGYSIKSFTVRVKMSNMFNALSYNVHDDNSVNPIAPRMFTTTLTVKL